MFLIGFTIIVTIIGHYEQPVIARRANNANNTNNVPHCPTRKYIGVAECVELVGESIIERQIVIEKRLHEIRQQNDRQTDRIIQMFLHQSKQINKLSEAVNKILLDELKLR